MSFLMKQKKLDPSIIEKYFYTNNSEKLYKYLDSSKDNNSSHVFIKTRLNTLRYDMKKMSDFEIKEKNLDLLINFFEEILDVTRAINNKDKD